MKLLTAVMFLFTVSAFAQTITLPEYNWSLTDILSRGQTKERLYQNMNRTLVKTGNSICSNRALIWTYDFKRKNDIETGKLFLFYTEKNSRTAGKTWWYHVTPVINEGGTIWTMDAGFPGFVSSPLSQADWLMKFSGTSKCQPIAADDTEFFERMFKGRVFPDYTAKYGRQDCYTIIVPSGLWTPASIAKNILGKDENGRPTRQSSDHFDMDELFDACVEAVTNPLGRFFGSGKKRCSDYLSYSRN